MAITITDRALEEFTDYWQDPVNKYIRLYSRKMVFNDGVTILGTATTVAGCTNYRQQM